MAVSVFIVYQVALKVIPTLWFATGGLDATIHLLRTKTGFSDHMTVGLPNSGRHVEMKRTPTRKGHRLRGMYVCYFRIKENNLPPVNMPTVSPGNINLLLLLAAAGGGGKKHRL